jgi:2-aminoadipate transaminase
MFTLNRSSDIPLYKQLIEQASSWIDNGDLQPGAALPSIRELARDLQVGQITVRQAYDELIGRGLIVTRKGSGTFVASHPAKRRLSIQREELEDALETAPPMSWEPYKFDSDFFGMPKAKGSAQQMVDLSRAQPDPSLFPFARIKYVVRDMLWTPKEFFFDRGHSQGFQPLVEWLEHEMALQGIDMRPGTNEILLTGGFQRGLSLVLDMLGAQKESVVVEAPTYSGILNLLKAKGIQYSSVPVDGAGMDTEYLAQLLKKERVKAIVTVPTYHNPTGVVLSRERRQHLASLAVRHRVPVIEDDWGSQLRYTGESVQPLKAQDPGGYIIHLGSFSKTFLPGLRIGWITVPGAIAVTLMRAKLAADHGDSWFLQVLLYDFIRKGYFHKHLRRTLKAYSIRRATMLSALREHMPEGVGWNEPAGGLTVWLRLPRQIMSTSLLKQCRASGLDFAPAPLFTPDRRDAPALRLSFSRSRPEEITAGVAVLGAVLRKLLRQPEQIAPASIGYSEFL